MLHHIDLRIDTVCNTMQC